jgi:lysophospholipase L1-like esterase
MRFRRFGLAFAVLAALLAGGGAFAKASPVVWTASWATSQLALDDKTGLDPAQIAGATVRQIVRLSVGGDRVRLRLSNAFGTAPLSVTSVHLALAVAPGRAAIEPSSDRTVRFDGRESAIIPAGAEYTSDPVALKVPARGDVAISIRYDAPAVQTGHPGSRTTSFLLAGDHVGDADLPGAVAVDRWFQIAAIEAQGAMPKPVVAVIGDSITDGRGSTTNGNDRWTDALANRLKGRAGVLNFGIGGNRMLNDGLGPNVLARFDRDVLGAGGVKTLILFEAVNDLGTFGREASVSAAGYRALADRIVGAYRQIVLRAHRHGIKVIGATITPYGGSGNYHATAAREAARQAINDWIRTKGNFDAMVDFDALVRDPVRPDRLQAAYDCGDHLHLSPAGYRAMGEAVPLALLTH